MEKIRISRIDEIDEYYWVEDNFYSSESDYGFSNTCFYIPFLHQKDSEEYVKKSRKLCRIVSSDTVKKYYEIDDKSIEEKIMSEHRDICNDKKNCECEISGLDIDWEQIERDALQCLNVDWV